MSIRALALLAAAVALLIASATAVAAVKARSTPPADPYAWARDAATGLVEDGSWPALADVDLARDATRGDLDTALAILGGRPVAPSATPTAPASIWTAHLLMTRALGLEGERRALARLTTADGVRLRLPRHLGSEILVRELGLVHNYQADDDRLERFRRQPIRMAELVYMLAAARDLSSWELEQMARYRTYKLPAMSPARLTLVQAALSQVGQPYIWGGDWPSRRSPWGAQASPGFDCSGLAWWSFKGARAARAMEVGSALRGRTADDMAYERPAERIPAEAAQPGDLVFFGPLGTKSKRGTISHMAISLGDGWIVHSSGSRAGVSISSLDAYWPSGTAFGRALPALS